MEPKKRSTQSRIVNAAWNLFYKQGYESTTVDQIIEQSGTSKGTFYHYFKAKDALLSSLSYLFDEKYRELYPSVDPNTNACEKLLYLNLELFTMIEKQVDINLLAYLYSSQLVTKDQQHLLDHNRFYFTWLTEIIASAIESGEFSDTGTAEEYMQIYAMFERALIYDWSLRKGEYSLAEYSQKLMPHMLNTFRIGI